MPSSTTPLQDERIGDGSPNLASAKSTLSWLGHPVTVLVLGSLLSALVIPWISSRINHRRLISDARLQRSFDILKNCMETDQRLNTMVTSMEMFIKDSASAGIVTRNDRQQIRVELARQYRDFDEHAWWWLSRLPTEARLLGLDVDPEKLSGIIVEYRSNLIRSGAALDKLWHECLRKDSQPSAAPMSQLASQTRKNMSDLQRQRQDLTGKLVYLFAPTEPTIQHLLSQQ